MNKDSKVILIQACKQGSLTDSYKDQYPYPPLGLISLSNVLKMNGYDSELFDLYLQSINKTGLIEKLKEMNYPLLIGISSYTDSIEVACNIARLCKEIFPKTKILLGGAHVTFMYKEVMENCEYIDFCCIGEGEGLIVELIEHIKNSTLKIESIKNLVYRNLNGNIIKNNRRGYLTEMDTLPFPDFTQEMLDMMKKKNNIVIISSKGCPGGCIFCASRGLSGATYRCHSAEWLISYLYYYHKIYHFGSYSFLDDTFTADKVRLKKFVNYAHQLKFYLPFICKSRADVISEDISNDLESINCVSVHIGVESGDDDVLKCINKKITLNDVYNAIKFLAFNSIRVECTFILGHPQDTKETLEKTLILANMLNHTEFTTSVIGVCTPFPGTVLWAKQNEYDMKFVINRWTQYNLVTPIFYTNNFCIDDLKKAYYFFNMVDSKYQMPNITDTDYSDFIREIDAIFTEVAKNKELRKVKI